MSDLNRVTLVGRLTRDAEYRSFDQDRGVIRFAIAVGRGYKKNNEWINEADYFDINQYVTSDRVMPYLKKGVQVSVDGELRQNRWEQDGQKRSRVEVQAQRVQLLGSPRSENHDGASSSRPVTNQQSQATRPQPAPKQATPKNNFDQDEFEEDFPF